VAARATLRRFDPLEPSAAWRLPKKGLMNTLKSRYQGCNMPSRPQQRATLQLFLAPRVARQNALVCDRPGAAAEH
jgi:hypothetical protein